MLHGDDGSEIVAGGAGLAACFGLAIAGPAVYVWKSVGGGRKTKLDPHGRPVLPAFPQLAFGYRPWFDNASQFHRPVIVLAFFEDLGIAFVMSVIGSVRPPAGACWVIALLLFFCCLAHLTYLALCRPYRTRLDATFAGIVAILQLVLAVIVFVAMFVGVEGVAGGIGGVALALGMSFIVQAAVSGLWAVVLFFRHRRRKREEAERDDEIAAVPLGRMKAQRRGGHARDGLLSSPHGLVVPLRPEDDPDFEGYGAYTTFFGQDRTHPLRRPRMPRRGDDDGLGDGARTAAGGSLGTRAESHVSASFFNAEAVAAGAAVLPVNPFDHLASLGRAQRGPAAPPSPFAALPRAASAPRRKRRGKTGNDFGVDVDFDAPSLSEWDPASLWDDEATFGGGGGYAALPPSAPADLSRIARMHAARSSPAGGGSGAAAPRALAPSSRPAPPALNIDFD